MRGSIPVPGPSTVRYGGNTACIQVYNNDNRIIFDAGSGIRLWGQSIDLSQKQHVHLFVTHPHWDHINGLPFCPAIFIPGNSISIYGPRTYELSLEDIINGQMRFTYFPIRIAELKSDLTFNEISDRSTVTLDNCTIIAKKLNHPVDCLGYKLTYNNKTFIYLGDNEPYYNVYDDDDEDVETMIKEMNNDLIEFVRDADVLVTDAQYTPQEYESKVGWGHSSTHHVTNMAIKANVKHLIYFHHEPNRSDDEIDLIVEHYQNLVQDKGFNLKIEAAREQSIIEIV